MVVKYQRVQKEAAMTVLVLGGGGFIGPRVIRKLVERDQQVVSLDINPLEGCRS